MQEIQQNYRSKVLINLFSKVHKKFWRSLQIFKYWVSVSGSLTKSRSRHQSFNKLWYWRLCGLDHIPETPHTWPWPTKSDHRSRNSTALI